MNSTQDAQIQAQLDRPGAGIPLPARLFLRHVLRTMVIKKTPWQESCENFERAHKKFLAEIQKLTPEQLNRRVLIPRIVGLEDSSRYWSPIMVARHLVIVGQAIEWMIVELSHGRTDKLPKADTAAVKPETDLDAQKVLSEYQAFGDGFLARVESAVGNRDSELTHLHPWFGPMRSKDWMWLMGRHTGIHRQQLKKILETAQKI
jgi:hypothetical protein